MVGSYIVAFWGKSDEPRWRRRYWATVRWVSVNGTCWYASGEGTESEGQPAIGEVVRVPDKLVKTVTASLSQSPVEVEGMRGKSLL